MQKKSRRDCFIPGCTSQMGQVIFLSAHKSDGLKRWWSESVWVQNRKNKGIPKNTRVCEKHFEEKYIDRSYKMPRLFPDAWPTKNIEEPKPEEMELCARQRADGKAKCRDPKLEFNAKMYCRLCGKREKRPMEDQLDHFKDGEEFLRLCLGEYFSRLDLPQGICNNCTESIESCLEFLRKCELTQHKLDVLFSRSEELKTEPECELLEVEELKQEKQEQDEQEESEHAQFIITEEVLEESVVSNIKEEQFLFSGNDHNSEEDYVAAEDDRASSDSTNTDEEYKVDSEVETEGIIVDSKPSKYSKGSCESYNESDSDYKDSPENDPPKKRTGRQARKSIRVLEEMGTLDVVDEFPEPKRRTKSATESKPKKSLSGSGESSRICPICGKILVHKGNFTSHLKIHSDKKDYVCNICGKQYYIRRELQMHIESLHEKKTFVCNICGIKCAWRKGLQRHMKNKHSDESSLKHKCTYCGKAFLLPNQLRLHVMKHTGDRITCEICGAGYRFNYMLTQHKIREHGMEFKGVKLYKNNSRSRKKDESKQAGTAAASTQQPDVNPPQVLDSNQDSILSSESSQPHQIQQQHLQQQQQQHQLPLQQYHHAAATQLERVSYSASFVYPGGVTPAMMLPPGGYNG
ncbi:zinc finger and SCAN domain-containing protein 31-like [Toxorhynchites rutilus septentrionalis]|uniref:zinc finger and SCAN domain-containing protein 31-like n=1 Tax=Toxorhynchites rutilus septentrionalis TaxID=329112 RepID=UPI002478EF67|nr:zinc finger and SCAN domain-containing protein 31-like [Toxorhynchites rutilus septentrionalis]